MMGDIFICVLNAGIVAGWVALFVMLARLFLKRMPAWISCLLWAVVGLRLTVPFSIESKISLIPSASPIPRDIASQKVPEINSGIEAIDGVINPLVEERIVPISNSGELVERIISISSYVWIIGIIMLAVYGAVSYMRLYKRVSVSLCDGDGVYYCDAIDTPFILGVIRPRIYLPSGISEEYRRFVIAHERAHISRGDHIWKALGFVLLSLYWFSPLLWISYALFCRDIERACDERVIGGADVDERKGYSEALLGLGVRKGGSVVCPLAFGEIGVRARIRSVLSYRRPAVWLVCIILAFCLILSGCFLSDPVSKNDSMVKKIMDEDGYTIADQSRCAVTLSFDASVLPSEAFSDEGIDLDAGEIVAYEENGFKIYLMSAQYANETNEKMYLAFDFIYSLEEDGGGFLSPWIPVGDGSMSTLGFTMLDKTLRDKNGEYEDAVSVRGQGPSNQLWFYVSTEALQKAEGRVEFDIILNRVTYFKEGIEGTVAIDYKGVEEYYKSLSGNVIASEAKVYRCYNTELESSLASPYIALDEVRGRFQFSWSPLSSYIARGSYEMNESELILKTDDEGRNIYRFRRDGEKFVFDAKGSSAIPSYSYSSDSAPICPVPDGAVFERNR